MFQALTSYDNSEGGAKKNKQEKKKARGLAPLSTIWNSENLE